MEAKSLIEIARDEIIERLDEEFYGIHYPYIQEHYGKEDF